MSTTTVRISNRAHSTLKDLAEEDNLSLTEELDRAIEAYRRQRFFDRVNQAYARLREDEEAWDDYREEIKVWDSTLADGLEDYPYE